MVLLVSLLTGLASALFPPVNIEAYLVGLAALHGGAVLWAGVVAVTVGHMAGKLLFYSLGRGWVLRRLPRWLSRRHEVDAHLPPVPVGPAGPAAAPVPAALDEVVHEVAEATRRPGRWAAVSRRLRLDRVEELAGRPWATAGLCFVSAAVGLPPFAVVAVLLGRFRMPVVSFLLVGGAGRLARFAVVAGAGGLVLH